MNEKNPTAEAAVLAARSSPPVLRDSDDASDALPQTDADAIVSQRLKPSPTWTAHQIFYVFILDGVGGMVLSAGVNFALAYVMYTAQAAPRAPVKLFALPNTLAGDAAVTIIVQCILTWFVELGLVRFDLRNRSVQPIGFIPRPKKPWLRWLFFLPAHDGEQTLRPRTMQLKAVLPEALRGFVLAFLGFVVLWPIGVGALTALGTKQEGSLDYTYDDKYVPQGFKAVLGGLLGLFTTPLMALFWLVRAGWEAEGLVGVSREVDEMP
ncbi:hypothetical protein NLU13_5115 [Sarocladium strictum]|uniref:Uncharacterized protein n=1 Tax=Sarocladium strictum TaxID=5046 RepID=A0AA39GMU2_SARSR|nr:hypothetical protein NLU13_5115 [Sarocladium strictum]